MAKKNDQDLEKQDLEKQGDELFEVVRKADDQFVVFPDHIVFFVDGKATVTAEERDQMKALGVI